MNSLPELVESIDAWMREQPCFSAVDDRWELLKALIFVSQLAAGKPTPLPERPQLPPPPIPQELPPKMRIVEYLIRDYGIVDFRMRHPDSLAVYFHVKGFWEIIGERLLRLRDLLAQETPPQPMPKKKNKDKVTPEMQEEILAWKGSKKELAAKLGISRQTIHAVLRKNSAK